MENADQSAVIEDAIRECASAGYVMIPGFLSAADLAPALAELEKTLPAPDAFANGSPEFRERYQADEVAGLVDFPFPGPELSLLAVHPKLVALAENVLGARDIRLYNAQAWAKYAGAHEYEQDLHRDFPGHTPLVPSRDPAYDQVNLFVLLSEVDEACGPPTFVDRRLTDDLPTFPNSVPRGERKDLYAAEVPGVGGPGTVIAYSIDTFHRGNTMARPGSHRYVLMTFFRRAEADWVQGPGQGVLAETSAWNDFVERASRRQLDLLGFPPRSHPFWTESTMQGFLGRYPNADTSWFEAS